WAAGMVPRLARPGALEAAGGLGRCLLRDNRSARPVWFGRVGARRYPSREHGATAAARVAAARPRAKGHAQGATDRPAASPPPNRRGIGRCRPDAACARGPGPRPPIPPRSGTPPAARYRARRGTRSPPAGLPQEDVSMANKMLIDATHPEETRVVV